MFGESTKRVLPAILTAVVLIGVGPLFAQDPAAAPNAEPDGQYEPGRAVARISVLNGDVSVRRGDSGDVVAAALNAPLMADDRLLTSSSSRAEVQLDSANMIRVGPNSEVRFTALDTQQFPGSDRGRHGDVPHAAPQPGAGRSGYAQRGRSSAAAGRLSSDGA